MTESLTQTELPEIPGYSIRDELGRGGMGVVYEAKQLANNRTVALKMILAGRGAGFVELARFRVEAEAVACLQHPNIIRIHEVGVHGGFPYFALEFAEGGSLAKPARPEPRTPRWAAEVVERLAQAIQLAHDRGIVHRDLKPANVLLARDGTPKITDFGLAKFERPIDEVSEVYATMAASPLDAALYRFAQDYEGEKDNTGSSFSDYVVERTWQDLFGDAGASEDGRDLVAVKEFVSEATRQSSEAPPSAVLVPELTRTGAIMGSPHYMSPEQAWGRTASAGPASDIYGLGAVLYWLLAGRPPFQGETLEELLFRVRTASPDPIRASVNPELEAICLKCLEKEPSDRYLSAGDLAHDLRRFLAGRSIVGTLRPEEQADLEEPETTRLYPEPPREESTPQAPDLPKSTAPAPTKSWWQIWK